MPGEGDRHLPILVCALRSALERLQVQEKLRPDDPALREIKNSIVRTIARRETEEREDTAA